MSANRDSFPDVFGRIYARGSLHLYIWRRITQITFPLLSRSHLTLLHHTDMQINTSENSFAENAGSNFSGNKFNRYTLYRNFKYLVIPKASLTKNFIRAYINMYTATFNIQLIVKYSSPIAHFILA